MKLRPEDPSKFTFSSKIRRIILSTRTTTSCIVLLSLISEVLSYSYCVNLKCSVKQDRKNDFLELIRENQRLTLEEPEALQYTVGQDIEDPNTFYIHEQFLSPEGFAFHRKTPHNAEWQKFRSTDPFLETPVASFYHGTHEPEKVPIREAYCLNVKLCIDPDKREEFLSVIENNAKGSNTLEPSCLQYIWGEDESIKNTFHFHEQYIGEQGFLEHKAAPHFDKWEQFVTSNPFTEEPVVNFFRTI